MPRIALRRRAPLVVVATVFAALALLTCVYPTDRSGEVYVSVTSSDTLLLRDSLLLQGTTATLTAQAWQRLAGGDSAAIPNTQFAWLSSTPATAIVQGVGGGIARLTGVASGRTTVSVVPVAYQGSKSAAFPLRVSTPFRIDSVRADTASYSPVATFNGDATHRTVKYGQLLTFYGVGIRGIFLATLGSTALFPDTFSFKGVPAGVGQMSFWVPFPAQTAKPVVLALGGNAFDTTTIKVFRRDIYKVSVPNDTLPRKLSLDGAGPIAQLPIVIVADPALAFEELPRGDTLGADWYRFTRTDTTGPMTLIVTTTQTGNLAELVLSDSIVYQSSTKSYAIGSSAWTIGLGEYDCRGRRFLPAQSTPDSLIIALKGPLPSRVLHVLSQYAVPGSYGLDVVSGYLTLDPTIGPDRFEPNRICTQADANFLDPLRKITVALGTSFRDSALTIDNPHAVDWYRFQVGGLVTQTVTITSHALPFATVDSSDIDLYVLTSDTLGLLGTTSSPGSVGSDDTLSVLLAPGQYYLVVVDFAGIPTRYSLCMVAGLSCSPPVSASRGAPAAVGTGAALHLDAVRRLGAGVRPSSARRSSWRP